MFSLASNASGIVYTKELTRRGNGGQATLRCPLGAESQTRVHLQFIRFLVPLAVATLALEIGGQFLNGGMARVPRATETLAAFGLALGLKSILTGALYQSRQLALAMIDNRLQLRSASRFVFTAGVLLSVATAVLGLPGLGRWVVKDLHDLTTVIADQTQLALLLMSPLPLINGLSRYLSGLLARYRRTEIITLSQIGSILTSIAAVLILLGNRYINQTPILLPVAATFLGAIIEFGVLLWGHLRFSRPSLPIKGPSLTIRDILHFLWPLAVIMIFQGFSRPLINLIVSRGSNGTEALAVLTVIYTLGHIHYGWVNENRSLIPVFRDETGYLPYARRFIVACGCISFAMALILFWTPIRWVLLIDLIGVTPELAELCVQPLMVFTFFPFAVTLRAYYHGVGIVNRITQSMATSGPSRLTAISIGLFVLSFFDLPGATRGIGALLCGFSAEAIVLAWGVRRKLKAIPHGEKYV